MNEMGYAAVRALACNRVDGGFLPLRDPDWSASINMGPEFERTLVWLETRNSG
jgi:hypothetical protein